MVKIIILLVIEFGPEFGLYFDMVGGRNLQAARLN